MLATKPYCYVCGGTRPRHENGCVVDLALAELNFATSDDRDAARIRLEFSTASTLPPNLDAPPSSK